MPLALHVRMRARRPDETHRASTPLELLFDLVFVVAIGSLSTGLAEAELDGRTLTTLPFFLFVTAAVWWAWMNFTWFASAYDTDDVPYRLLTVLQMAGVLVIAAGVPTALHDSSLVAITIGYVIMRVALIAQWLRAAAGDPEHRRVALRYAGAISVIQVGWVLRLLLPEHLTLVSSLALFSLELAVPYFAEHGNWTGWHAGHIAERYGLFVLIILGEAVLSATRAVQRVIEQSEVSAPLVVVGLCALLTVVGLWWIYFQQPTEELATHRSWALFWGYGHYVVFAALAAVSAGLEALVDWLGEHAGEEAERMSPVAIIAAVTVPIAVLLVVLWVLHRPLARHGAVPLTVTVIAVVLLLVITFDAATLGVVGSVVAATLVLAATVAVATVRAQPRTAAASG